jgi:outer membrane protein OmpA-like peptidoglycan-associated protein
MLLRELTAQYSSLAYRLRRGRAATDAPTAVTVRVAAMEVTANEQKDAVASIACASRRETGESLLRGHQATVRAIWPVLPVLVVSTTLPTAQQLAPAIRLEPGLVVVSAIVDKVHSKDYELVSRVERSDAAGVALALDWAIPDRQAPDGVTRKSARLVERADDAQHARRLILWHMAGDPDTFPGTTGPTASVDVFNDVRLKGEAAVVVGAVSTSDGVDLPLLGGLLASRKYFRGTVKRVGTETLNVLVNGAPTSLRALHAAGTLTVASDRGDAEFWWLDDPASRLALRHTFQGTTSQVVKIDRPTELDRIQQALAGRACRSELPGVYFLTDSAELLPASQGTIARFAAILNAHSDWNVTIEGHTDSIGGDQHNLVLSRRRAESVKHELVAKHGVAAARLQTAGYGRTHPVDTNDTVEGRAHNRRVEVARRC